MAQLNKDIMNSLSGLDGLVYIMFFGAERYAAQFREKFVKYGLIKHEENVNQSIKRLTTKGDRFLKFLREKHTRGRPAKIYTAKIEPLQQTFEVMTQTYGSSSFEDKELQKVLPRFIFEYFLRFVSIEKKYFNYDIRYLNWHHITITFYNFICLLAIDFALEEWNLPKEIRLQIQHLSPLGFLFPLPKISPRTKGGMLKEFLTLKDEILKDMTEAERSFFRRYATLGAQTV